MLRHHLTQAERDIILVLCEAAAEYHLHGAEALKIALFIFEPRDWELLQSIIYKLSENEPMEFPE